MLHPAQQQRIDQFGVPKSVDIHCHLLYGIDDGPESLDESIELCRALVADGITTVVATPHQLGRYDRLNSAQFIGECIEELEGLLEQEAIPLEIISGGDVRVDERLLKLLDEGDVRSVGEMGAHILLELPHDLYIDPTWMIEALVERGMQPIMTHPERHRYLTGSVGRIEDWLARGAILQVTSGSLIGDFGQRASAEAWRLIHHGLVDLVASDAHDAHARPPRMTAALDLLVHELGLETSRALCLENPLKVFEGEKV